MARSMAERAETRAGDRTATVRNALAGNDGGRALTVAIDAVRAEAAKVRRQRPADAPLIDADLAAILLHIASGLHAHRPARPKGCPRVPRPADMLIMFDTSAARAAAVGEPG